MKVKSKNYYFIDRYSLRGLFCLGGSLQNHRRVFWLAGGSLKVQNHRGHHNFEFSPYAQGKGRSFFQTVENTAMPKMCIFCKNKKITSIWQRNMGSNFCTSSIGIKINLMYLGISTPTNPSRYQEASSLCWLYLENPGTISSGTYGEKSRYCVRYLWNHQ